MTVEILGADGHGTGRRKEMPTVTAEQRQQVVVAVEDRRLALLGSTLPSWWAGYRTGRYRVTPWPVIGDISYAEKQRRQSHMEGYQVDAYHAKKAQEKLAADIAAGRVKLPPEVSPFPAYDVLPDGRVVAKGFPG